MTRVVCAAIVVSVPFGGCLSTSVPDYRYYTLDMRPGSGVETDLWVRSVRIRTAEALANDDILIRTGPTTIEYYALDRWASGLEEQLAEKLSAEFAQRRTQDNVLDIEGTVFAFEQSEVGEEVTGRVKLQLDVEINGRPAIAKTYTAETPARAASASAAVVALSRATEQIIQELAVDIAAVRSGD